jgi:hypothetical protein
MAAHSNLFHEALVKVPDVTTNGPLNAESRQDVHEVVYRVLEAARRTVGQGLHQSLFHADP